MPRVLRREYRQVVVFGIANTLAIAHYIQQALCHRRGSLWSQGESRIADKRRSAIGKFCKRAGGLKKPPRAYRWTSTRKMLKTARIT